MFGPVHIKHGTLCNHLVMDVQFTGKEGGFCKDLLKGRYLFLIGYARLLRTYAFFNKWLLTSRTIMITSISVSLNQLMTWLFYGRVLMTFHDIKWYVIKMNMFQMELCEIISGFIFSRFTFKVYITELTLRLLVAYFALLSKCLQMALHLMVLGHLHTLWWHTYINYLVLCASSVRYKTKFGSQNFGYQLWCLFCNISNVLKNMFNVGLIIMW